MAVVIGRSPPTGPNPKSRSPILREARRREEPGLTITRTTRRPRGRVPVRHRPKGEGGYSPSLGVGPRRANGWGVPPERSARRRSRASVKLRPPPAPREEFEVRASIGHTEVLFRGHTRTS